MAFGGLGVMFYGGHWSLSASSSSLNSVFHNVDIRSMFFATMFVIIIIVLAYLTNPSETSFRTYLTEQSFRQHLSRLDENNQDDQSDSEDSGVHFTLSRHPSSNTVQKIPGAYEPIQSLHFVNRAAVSLRTPKHIFYSFGVVTIAAVLPSGATNRSSINGMTGNMGFMVSESWFIGAFGKWWRGGPIQSWWISSVTATKDAERCNSGVLDMKALDSLECYEGLSFNPTAAQSQSITAIKDSPSKARGTERSIQRTTSSTSRSTTPPPLPKSASLPLHVPRVTPTTSGKAAQPSATPAPELTKLTPPQVTSSPSAIFDQSPILSELLRQISTSKTAIHDVKAQIHDVRAAASKSYNTIQKDLDQHRERKRSEDAARTELKTRTKTLEDSKRSSEAGKRDAEKRLRAAESARDNATERIARLDKEIGELKVRMEEDQVTVVKCEEESQEQENQMVEEMEKKRKEIKVAEDVVAALNARAKELEEKIAQEEEKLTRAKEVAELKKQDQAFYPLHVPPTEAPWAPLAAQTMVDPHAQINMDGTAQIEVFPPSLQVSPAQHRAIPAVEESTVGVNVPPRTRHTSLGNISNYSDQAMGENLFSNGQIAIRTSFDEEMPALSSGRTQSTRFSPFGDNELEEQNGMAISPRSSSLIPTSLIKTLDVGGATTEDLSRSFQSESDAILERDWRKVHPFPAQPVEPTVFNSSPTSINFPSFDGVDQEDPFEIRPPPPPLRHRITNEGVATEQTFLSESLRNNSEPKPLSRSRTRESDLSVSDKAVGGHHRWFSSGKTHAKEKEKKGLNPEAKVFHFKKSFPIFGGGSGNSTNVPTTKSSPYDLGAQPASIASTLSIPSIFPPPSDTDSTFSTLSMRAFAPSPAEREALSRALGSSANKSLDLLPTLSDVVIGGMPSSPNNRHAITAATVQTSPAHSLAEPGTRTSLLAPGFAWLQSLPRMRKPKFSPWDDENTEDGHGSGGAGSGAVEKGVTSTDS